MIQITINGTEVKHFGTDKAANDFLKDLHNAKFQKAFDDNNFGKFTEGKLFKLKYGIRRLSDIGEKLSDKMPPLSVKIEHV